MAQTPHPEAVTPVQVRAEFEQLIVDDLYGPAGGPDEALDVTPQDRYLVGMLAPQRSLPEPGEEAGTGDPAGGDDAGPLEESAKPMLFPSGKGLSFVVPTGTPGVLVEAAWGRYERTEAAPSEAPEPSEGLAGEADPEPATARPGLVWQRHPAGGAVAVDLPQQGGRIEPVSPDPQCPDVFFTGRAVRRADALIVSLFLVNGQLPLKRRVAERWLFQAEFAVTGLDGEPVFVGRDGALPARTLTGGVAEQGELAQLAMMYRRQVEFAVGHGTGVHAQTAAADPFRAVQVQTRSVPRSEVPRTDPPRPDEPGFGSLGDTTFDMRTLSDRWGTRRPQSGGADGGQIPVRSRAGSQG